MTALAEHETLVQPAIAASSRTRLVATAVSHAVVDFFSFTIIPVMTVLKGKVELTDRDAAVLLAVGSVTSGLIQPAVAWLTDRFDTRWLGTIGFLVLVISIGLVGYAESHAMLLLLSVFAAAGSGAFHPVAAAAMGQLSGAHRSFGLSIFYCAGMVGGVAGNMGTPFYVKHFGHGVALDGLPALAYLIAPGVLSVVVLAWAVHAVAHRHHGAHASHAALPPVERRQRWWGVGRLYIANVLRFGVDTAVIIMIIRWTERLALARFDVPQLTEAARTYAAQVNGPLQAAKQIGMGVGSLAIGWYIRRGGARERWSMILVPLIAAVSIPLIPRAGPSIGFLLVLLAGLGYGSLVAPTIAMAQRLLPHRTGLASALMMGGAWSVSAAFAPLADAMVDHVGLNWSFTAMGALCIASAVLAAKRTQDPPGG